MVDDSGRDGVKAVSRELEPRIEACGIKANYDNAVSFPEAALVFFFRVSTITVPFVAGAIVETIISATWQNHSPLKRMVCHEFLIDEVMHHFSPPYLRIVTGILLTRWKRSLWTSLTPLKKSR